MIRKIINLLSSTKVALVLLVVISLSCVIGVSLPRAIGKEVVFSSGWFNLLLAFLTVNIVWCIGKRTPVLRLSQAGTTVFHLGLVLLFAGVVYDQLFFLRERSISPRAKRSAPATRGAGTVCGEVVSSGSLD